VDGLDLGQENKDMHDIAKEKDWKMLRAMAPELRERYLSARNAELSSILANHHLSQTERFWMIEERTKEIAKVLRECLDGHSRSKMEFFIMVMIAHDMMTEDDISKFSEEVQERMSSQFR
jgi:hypothetical protein